MDEFTFQSFQGNMMSQVREGERNTWVGKMWSTGAKAVCHYHQKCVSPSVDLLIQPPAKRVPHMIAQHTLFTSFWLPSQEDHP